MCKLLKDSAHWHRNLSFEPLAFSSTTSLGERPAYECADRSVIGRYKAKCIVGKKLLTRTEEQYLHRMDYEFLHELVPRQLLIQLDEIVPCERIGSGHFGVVYKALLNRGKNAQFVAVKTLKGIILERLSINCPLRSVNERQARVFARRSHYGQFRAPQRATIDRHRLRYEQSTAHCHALHAQWQPAHVVARGDECLIVCALKIDHSFLGSNC